MPVIRIAATFSLVSPLAILAAMPIAAGLRGVGPVLALPAGAGWYLILRNERPLAALGTLLWYFGMVFVIIQDAIQLALVTKLPAAYVAADVSMKPTIEMFGASLAYLVEVLATVSQYVTRAGILILALLMMRAPSIPMWIGILTFASAIVDLLAAPAQIVLPQVDAIRTGALISLMVFLLVCIPALGAVMWRWKGEVAPGASG